MDLSVCVNVLSVECQWGTFFSIATWSQSLISSSSVQVGSSFVWTVTECYDSPCCIVLLANTTFYGPCILMSEWLPCWRVTLLSELIISILTVEFTSEWFKCKTCMWLVELYVLCDSGTECFLLLILLVKELHGYHSEIVYTCCPWDFLHTTVSTLIYFCLPYFSEKKNTYETCILGGLTSEWFSLEASLLTLGLTIGALSFVLEPTPKTARRMFYGSLLYLPAFMAGLLLHRLPNEQKEHNVTQTSEITGILYGAEQQDEERARQKREDRKPSRIHSRPPVAYASVAPFPFLPVPIYVSTQGHELWKILHELGLWTQCWSIFFWLPKEIFLIKYFVLDVDMIRK